MKGVSGQFLIGLLLVGFVVWIMSSTYTEVGKYFFWGFPVYFYLFALKVLAQPSNDLKYPPFFGMKNLYEWPRFSDQKKPRGPLEKTASYIESLTYYTISN